MGRISSHCSFRHVLLFFLSRLCKRWQENAARQGQARGKRQPQQGQARTAGHAGTDPKGTDPELCVCSLVGLPGLLAWIHKQPPHSSAPQRAPCLRDHGGEDQRLWGHRMPWLSPWLLSLQGAAQIQAACFFTVRVMGEPPRDAGGEERGGRSTTGCTQQGQQLPEDTHRK